MAQSLPHLERGYHRKFVWILDGIDVGDSYIGVSCVKVIMLPEFLFRHIPEAVTSSFNQGIGSVFEQGNTHVSRLIPDADILEL